MVKTWYSLVSRQIYHNAPFESNITVIYGWYDWCVQHRCRWKPQFYNSNGTTLATSCHHWALSINIELNLWPLTNNVLQIHMEILQHFHHQNYNIIELIISYPMIPSSLSNIDTNHPFVYGQRFSSIIIESAT